MSDITSPSYSGDKCSFSLGREVMSERLRYIQLGNATGVGRVEWKKKVIAQLTHYMLFTTCVCWGNT